MADAPAGSESPYAPSKAVERPARRRGRRIPPLWVWCLVAVCVGIIVWVRLHNSTGDHAVDNILTLIFGFVAYSVIACWFLFLSGYSGLLRALSAVGVMAAVVLFFGLFEISQVSGELVPIFRFRWAPPPDELLEVPAERAAGEVRADLATTTADDFPQFLGPDRNARVEGVRLARDWDSNPPRPLWRQPIGAGWSAFAAVNGFAVTLEQRGNDELVTCYEVSTGRLIWSQGVRTRHETTLGGVGPRSTPTIDSGRVYTLGATGTLLCLEGATGEILWSDDLLRRYQVTPQQDGRGVAWGRSGSPLVVDNLVVVPAGGPAEGPHVSLLALDKQTGEKVWEGGQRQVAFASPIVATLAGVRQIISVNQDYVSGHDIASGSVLWETSWPGGSTSDASVSQPVVLSDERLFLSKGYSGGAALLEVSAAADASFVLDDVWRDPRLLKTKFTNVVIHDGHAYGLSDGILECVRLEDGQRRWKRGRYGHGQLLGVDEVILVQAESGEVALVAADPTGFRPLASLPALSAKTWNNPCLYGRHLLVRNAEEACCYELAVESAER